MTVQKFSQAFYNQSFLKSNIYFHALIYPIEENIFLSIIILGKVLHNPVKHVRSASECIGIPFSGQISVL